MSPPLAVCRYVDPAVHRSMSSVWIAISLALSRRHSGADHDMTQRQTNKAQSSTWADGWVGSSFVYLLGCTGVCVVCVCVRGPL